jgi:hypothetical protein
MQFLWWGFELPQHRQGGGTELQCSWTEELLLHSSWVQAEFCFLLPVGPGLAFQGSQFPVHARQWELWGSCHLDSPSLWEYLAESNDRIWKTKLLIYMMTLLLKNENCKDYVHLHWYRGNYMKLDNTHILLSSWKGPQIARVPSGLIKYIGKPCFDPPKVSFSSLAPPYNSKGSEFVCSNIRWLMSIYL